MSDLIMHISFLHQQQTTHITIELYVCHIKTQILLHYSTVSSNSPIIIATTQKPFAKLTQTTRICNLNCNCTLTASCPNEWLPKWLNQTQRMRNKLQRKSGRRRAPYVLLRHHSPVRRCTPGAQHIWVSELPRWVSEWVGEWVMNDKTAAHEWYALLRGQNGAGRQMCGGGAHMRTSAWQVERLVVATTQMSECICGEEWNEACVCVSVKVWVRVLLCGCVCVCGWVGFAHNANCRWQPLPFELSCTTLND